MYVDLTLLQPSRASLPLSQEVPVEFGFLPEFLIYSVADFILFCSRYVRADFDIWPKSYNI